MSHEPLFQNITLENTVIDNLHLFLRVSDVLIDLLVVELHRQDAIDKVKKFTTSDLTKYSKYQEFVSSLGIPGFEFYIRCTSKELKFRSLTGPKKLKLFRNMNIQVLLPNNEPKSCCCIQHLWEELLGLNTIITKSAEDLSESTIHTRTRKWGESFFSVYQRKHVTLCIHTLMNHVGEFMKIHGSILPFTQQGLEKNNVITKSYF